MLNSDLIALERAVYRAAREQLSSDNQTEQPDGDAARRDRDAAAVIGPIIDDPAFYHLVPERFIDQTGRIADDAYQEVLRAAINDLYYFGPLEDLLYDESLSEIMVNGPDSVWIERSGRLMLTDVHFEDDDHVKFTIDRIAAGMNRRCDEASPLCDCTIVRPGTPFNGSRVNAVLKGVAVDHHLINIRKFRKDALTPEALMANGSFDGRMLEIMRAIVQGRMSTIVAGGTGSGKTTLLNAISLYIPPEERIITIEDTPELRLQTPHVERMQTREANTEGEGSVSMRELVALSLRRRPDRIIVGECRGAEAYDMLQAMQTDHPGSMTTVHANDPGNAISRLRTMVGYADGDLSRDVIVQQIAESLQGGLVVHVERMQDGARRVTSIVAIDPLPEGSLVIPRAELFVFDVEGVDAYGAVAGEWRACGVQPQRIKERMRASGVWYDPAWFFDR